ncbi:MAG: alpha/beta fold hydrolase [Cytophagales bacterium]
MVKIISRIVLGLVVTYLCFIVFLFVIQNKFVFRPAYLSSTYKYKFKNSFSEFTIHTSDGASLNTLWFRNDTLRKPLVFFIHGNGGNLSTWGHVSQVYLNMGYDFLIFDYRNYGKSRGGVPSQEQLLADVKCMYQWALKHYDSNQIIIAGYSLGTGLASELANVSTPKYLLLHAPYTSFKNILKEKMPFVPSCVLRYNLDNLKNVKACKCPVVIFHGDADTQIPISHSLFIKQYSNNKNIKIESLQGQGHDQIIVNPKYPQLFKKHIN